jgi:hypothetical protein
MNLLDLGSSKILISTSTSLVNLLRDKERTPPV